MAASKSINWYDAKETWLQRNLVAPEGHKFSLAQLAELLGVTAGTVRNRASKEKWSDELQAALKERAELSRTKLIESQTQALSVLQESIANTEIEVRKRHLGIARTLQDKAKLAIESIIPEKLSARDAIELLKVGLLEERRALGYAEMSALDMEGQQEGIKKEFSTEEAHELMNEIIDLIESDGVYTVDGSESTA